MINNLPQLGIFSLVGVIMLVLSSSSYVYLARIEKQTQASRLMAHFFLCVSLSALATILTNLDQPWSWAFAPSQDGLLILGGVFLAQFAFTYPDQKTSGNQRWIVGLFVFLAVLALSYSAFFAIDYLRNITADLDEIQAYYLLTPVTVVGLITLMLFRSISLSRGASPVQESQNPSAFSLLLKPQTAAAYGFRNLALAFMIALVPLVVFLLKPYISGLITSFAFNFGIVLAISAVMIVYLNMAVEYTSLMAKLVGISLVGVLLLLGGICTTILHFFPLGQPHLIVGLFIGASILSSGLVIGLFPLLFNSTIVDPLNRLLAGVRAVNQGDLEIQVDVKFTDELGFLTESFNSMISTLRNLSSELEEKAARLELVNAQQTEQLLEEIQQRGQIQEQLNRQLAFEKALAGSSRILLRSAESLIYRQQLLDQVLETLRDGVQASRAYIFEFYTLGDGVDLMRMLGEDCAAGIPPQISNEINQRFPVADFPAWFYQTLQKGEPIHGPIEQLLGNHPLRQAFLSQNPPILSAALFPISIEGILWGYIGFDDCLEPREWSSSAVNYLGIASEIIGSTIKRWDISDQLNDSMENLEDTVRDRTQHLNRSNERLRSEIATRKKLQGELEDRLRTKLILVRASAQLADAAKFYNAVEEVLADLGLILNAESVFLVINPKNDPAENIEAYQWNLMEDRSLDQESVDLLLTADLLDVSRTEVGEPIRIDDLSQQSVPANLRTLAELNRFHSLIIWPLITGDLILGWLLVWDSGLGEEQKETTLQTLDLFIKMLSGMLERELIVSTLEQRVTDQTREISSLYEMTLQTAESSNLPDVLYPALLRVMEMSQSEVAFIQLFDREMGSLELISSQGLSEELEKDLKRVPVEDELLDWLEKPDLDYGLLGNSELDIPAQLRLPGFGTVLISRLRVANMVLGILGCYRQAEALYSHFQISIMAVVGELLGVVVMNYYRARERQSIAAVQERQRLARDLHDAVSQSLYSLSLFARSARDAQQAGEQDKLADSLQLLEENSLSALREMRLLLYQLRSIALDEADLAEAVETRLDMVERRLGIQTDFEIDQGIQLSSDLEHDLFQIITEALNNSLRYAGADRVSVKLKLDGQKLELIIKDNGVGFAIDQVQKGMGLENIEERLLAYHGKFTIDSGPGKGTSLFISLELTPDLKGWESNV